MRRHEVPAASPAFNPIGAARLPSLLVAVLFALTPTALVAQADTVPDDALPRSLPLESHEYDLWEGEWFTPSSFTASPSRFVRSGPWVVNAVHEMLSITSSDADGFTYRFDCRDLPYGPNAYRIADARATFRDPFNAKDEVSGRSFALTVNPDDRHARMIRTGPRPYPCLPPEDGSNEFVFRRATFRAGFDCDQAATPVEMAICGNELIALGDREMTEAYRALRAASSPEDGVALRTSQRAWLSHRNRACLGGDEAVDEVCLARLYSDRLVELARAEDPGLGVGPGFDAAYVTALLNRGADLGQTTAVRLAMYPMRMSIGTWHADDGGILFESTHTDEHIVGLGMPSYVQFRYSRMLFAGPDGSVCTAQHVEPLLDLEEVKELYPYGLWGPVDGGPFTIWSDTGDAPSEPSASGVPNLVKDWLIRHPVTETMRYVP